MQGLNNFFKDNHIHSTVISTTVNGPKWKALQEFSCAWVKILKICIFRKSDIIHLNVSSRGSCLRKSILALTCIALRQSYLIHLHGSEFQVFYHNELGKIGRLLVNFVFRHAQKVVALSDSWRVWIETTMMIENVVVVFNGVPPISVERQNNNNPTILFLGRLGKRKGTDELILAMRKVLQEIPNTTLELGGDGDIEVYRRQVSDLKNIQFLGWLDESQKRSALGRATIFCLPSWNEGLPMSILEAMSAGLPVVSTPVGGIPEAVQENITGLLVPPGDTQELALTLCKLLSAPDLSKKMGDMGKKRYLESFSTNAMGRSFLRVYKTCI